MTKILKILLADDHPILLSGLSEYVNNMDNCEVVAQAANGMQALNNIIEKDIDIAILDIDMPYFSGLEVARKVKSIGNEAKIVILTLHKEQDLFEEAKEIGCHGYLLKEFALEEIKECISLVQQGSFYFSSELNNVLEAKETIPEYEKLTNTERKVLTLVSQAKTSTEIADLLFISKKTVENHRSNICKKLVLEGGHNSLLKWAIQNKNLIT